MVVSPCYVPHFFCGTRQGRRTASSFGFPMTCGVGLTPRPLFYAYPGRISNNPHESMEPRCVLPSMRTISAPADCTRPLLGSGRNRYVRILPSGTAERSLFRIVRQKLLYVTYPKLSGPFVEFHKAIFWVGGWDPYSLPLFSNRSSKTIICSFSRGSTERCPAVQSGAAELAACARAFGMRLCRAKQEIPPFSRS